MKTKLLATVLVMLISLPVLFIIHINNLIDESRASGRLKEINILDSENSTSSYNKDGEFEFNLPLIIIDTNGTKIENEQKIEAEIKVYDNQYRSNYLSDYPDIISKVDIKIRGNSTRYYPKKQYSIEFIDDEGNDNDVSFLGMPKDADWILNAPFADKSLIRNYVAYNVTSNIMEYSPQATFCEVFIVDDGAEEININHYKGVYIAIEKIERGEDRVNIKKSDSRMEETSFIVAKDRIKPNDMFYRNYGVESYIYDYKLVNIYPKDPNDKQREYITKTISEFERVLYSDIYDDEVNGYGKYIDVDSFVDYFIINEFFKNTDAGILSTYIYKDLGDKIKVGPIWDFNMSLGNYGQGDIVYLDPTGFYMVQKSWFDRLVMDRNFIDKVVARYNMLRESYLSDDYLIKFISDTVNFLGDSIERNFEIWPFWMCDQEKLFRVRPLELGPLGSDKDKIKEYMNNNKDYLQNTEAYSISYDEEISNLKTFITKRGKWMDENIEYLYKFTE